MKRTFIAIKIPLSKETLEFIGEIKLQLKDERIKWVDSWNVHLTLFFLGDTDENLISEIVDLLADKLKSFKNFNLMCKGVGVFKDMQNLRAFWFGLEENETLLNLKKIVNQVLNSFGFETENKKFKPHLTLGRIKYLNNKRLLSEIIENYKDQTIQEIAVNEVIIYESKLTPKGPIYSIIEKIYLN
ncbi:MAG: RNA 2',3'-cyclic phosphodiesterase [Marinilabiliales bacterium]|nr:MAG: RNA 2',3'-cyclic phosphodiesterase [Marinilabiliales bacterium]